MKSGSDSASATDTATTSGSANNTALFRLVQHKHSRIIRFYEGNRLILTIRLSQAAKLRVRPLVR